MSAPAAPVVEGSQTSQSATASTSLAVVLPASIAADELLLIHLATWDRTHTTPTGWTLVKTINSGGGGRLSTFKKLADGTEGGTTVTVTISTTSVFCSIAQRISGADYELVDTNDGDVEQATSFTTGELVPPWLGADSLWMSLAGWVDDEETVTTYPVQYTYARATTVAGAGVNAGEAIAVACRRYKADVDTPGSYTLTGSESIQYYTLVVGPQVPQDSPDTSGPAGVEVSTYNGVGWDDLGSGGVYHRDRISIRHGRSDWAGQSEPAQLSMSLENRSGQWSPDLETAPEFPNWGRNTPVRVGKTSGESYAEWVDTPSHLVLSAPADASLDLAGDFDMRWEVTPLESPRPYFGLNSEVLSVIHKAAGTTGFYLFAWHSRVSGGMKFRFVWFDSGGTSHTSDLESVYPAGIGPWMGMRRAWRVTLDVSTGEVEWWVADSLADTFESLGSHVVSATAVEPSTAVLQLGGTHAVEYSAFPGRIHGFQLLDGIDGTPVADLDLTVETPGTTSITDDAGLDWTVGAGGRISNTQWRFHGEVAEVPTRWNLAGSDQWAPITANGLLRRIRSGKKLLQSPLRRGILRDQDAAAAYVAYWPMEDQGDENLTAFGADIGRYPLVLQSGTPTPASKKPFRGSDKLPVLGDDRWRATVDGFPASAGEWSVRMLIAPTDDAPTTQVELFVVYTSDLIYQVLYDGSTNGSVQVLTYRYVGTTLTLIHTGSNWGLNLADGPARFQITCEPNGSGVDVAVTSQFVGQSAIGGGADTFATAVPGAVRTFTLNSSTQASGLVVGHIVVESSARQFGLEDAIDGYYGEKAILRVTRLCREEDVPVLARGNPAECIRMGPQGMGSFSDALAEAADADFGVLHDSPDRLCLVYRSGTSIRDQASTFDVDYDGGDALGTPELRRDDQAIENDVTVTNHDGQTARAELTSGRLSTEPTPNGVGRYDTSADISVWPNYPLVDHAAARVRLGTVDTPRVNGLQLATHLPGLSAADVAAVLSIRPGDRIGLVDLPATIYPDDLPQIVQGWSEVLTSHEHTLAVNSTPAEPWDHLAVEGTPPARYDTAGSYLVTGTEAGATSIEVATLLGPEWTTDSGDFPFDLNVGGFTVTATACSGTGVQTFTVSALAHYLPGGADVRLAEPTYYDF